MLKKFLFPTALLILWGCNGQHISSSTTQNQTHPITDEEHCLVVKISDGDTLTCLNAQKEQLKIRLAEIDAPEKAQAYGDKSRQFLGKLVHEKQIKFVTTGKDRYQRIIATIYDDKGKNINLEMVKQGLAWAYPQYVKDKKYLTAQEKAQKNKKGLWQDNNPISPEQWRKQKKNSQAND